jgi:hypothetical protein
VPWYILFNGHDIGGAVSVICDLVNVTRTMINRQLQRAEKRFIHNHTYWGSKRNPAKFVQNWAYNPISELPTVLHALL